MPETDGVMDKNVGLHASIYALMAIPAIIYLYIEGESKLAPLVVAIGAALIYAWYSYKMYKGQNRKSALQLMFCSFFYLPIVLLAYLIWI